MKRLPVSLMKRLSQPKSAVFKLWILYFYIFWSLGLCGSTLKWKQSAARPRARRVRDVACSVSLMNRLNQKSSVFKMWMLYFQRITFSAYFVRNGYASAPRKRCRLCFSKISYIYNFFGTNKKKLIIYGCFIRLRLCMVTQDLIRTVI